MVGDFVIRRATAADRKAVLTIAAAGMREFGLEPDFAGLDADLGRLGEDRPGVVAEFVDEVFRDLRSGLPRVPDQPGRLARNSEGYGGRVRGILDFSSGASCPKRQGVHATGSAPC